MKINKIYLLGLLAVLVPSINGAISKIKDKHGVDEQNRPFSLTKYHEVSDLGDTTKIAGKWSGYGKEEYWATVINETGSGMNEYEGEAAKEIYDDLASREVR